MLAGAWCRRFSIGVFVVMGGLFFLSQLTLFLHTIIFALFHEWISSSWGWFICQWTVCTLINNLILIIFSRNRIPINSREKKIVLSRGDSDRHVDSDEPGSSGTSQELRFILNYSSNTDWTGFTQATTKYSFTAKEKISIGEQSINTL